MLQSLILHFQRPGLEKRVAREFKVKKTADDLLAERAPTASGTPAAPKLNKQQMPHNNQNVINNWEHSSIFKYAKNLRTFVTSLRTERSYHGSYFIKSNSRVKAWAKLVTKGRLENKTYLLDGWHLVEEAIKAKAKFHAVMATEAQMAALWLMPHGVPAFEN